MPPTTTDFSAGNSTFTSVTPYDTPTSPSAVGSDPYDPLYPNIVGSEMVTVVDGKVDAIPDAMHPEEPWPDYIVAAVNFGPAPGFPFAFDGTRASVQCTYVPTTQSLLQAYYHVPISVMYPSGLWLGLWAEDAEPVSGLVADAAPFYLELRSGSFIGSVFVETTYPFVVGTEYTFHLEWQAGTMIVDGAGDMTDVLFDGWARLFINGALVLELLDDDIFFGYTGSGSAGPHLDNTVDYVAFGWYGLMGKLDDIVINGTVWADITVCLDSAYTYVADEVELTTDIGGGTIGLVWVEWTLAAPVATTLKRRE
jgi:hypothetical protein